MVFAVTGATGYVGGRIVERLRSKGHKVYSMGRIKGAANDGQKVPFSLEDSEHRFPPDTEVLIHCAYDFRPHRPEQIEKVNGDGSIRVFESAAKAGIPHRIFISTISAFEGCVSRYGKVKLRVERSVLSSGGVVLRPGLVYGKKMGGMMGTLAGLIEKTPVVPLIGNGRQRQYLINENDLADLAEYFAEHPEDRPDRPVTAAHPEGMTFREILSAIADTKGKKVQFLPIPWRMVWLALKTAESAGLSLNMRSDSVVSLVHQNPAPDFTALSERGIKIIRFRDTL